MEHEPEGPFLPYSLNSAPRGDSLLDLRRHRPARRSRCKPPVTEHYRASPLDSRFYLFYLVKEMKRGELLGSLEHIILLALVRLDGSAHGMIVRREIEGRTGRNISIGAVYATLERLEAKGYVSSFTGEPTPERGGRAKRLFRVEAAGKRALQISEQTIRSMTAGLKDRWGTI
jgi:PadR family transcriptional regulator PadR